MRSTNKQKDCEKKTQFVKQRDFTKEREGSFTDEKLNGDEMDH